MRRPIRGDGRCRSRPRRRRGRSAGNPSSEPRLPVETQLPTPYCSAAHVSTTAAAAAASSSPRLARRIAAGRLAGGRLASAVGPPSRPNSVRKPGNPRSSDQETLWLRRFTEPRGAHDRCCSDQVLRGNGLGSGRRNRPYPGWPGRTASQAAARAGARTPMAGCTLVQLASSVAAHQAAYTQAGRAGSVRCACKSAAGCQTKSSSTQVAASRSAAAGVAKPGAHVHGTPRVQAAILAKHAAASPATGGTVFVHGQDAGAGGQRVWSPRRSKQRLRQRRRAEDN